MISSKCSGRAAGPSFGEPESTKATEIAAIFYLFFHWNCQGIGAHWDNFKSLLCEIHGDTFSFDYIGISETFRTDIHNLNLPGYHDIISRTRENNSRGGVGLYINENIQFTIREDISVFIPHIFESIFIEVKTKHEKKQIVGVIYRPNTAPKADINIFSTTFIL